MDIGETILENFEVRKSKAQKEKFRNFVKKTAAEYDYDCSFEKGSFKSQNIVIGNPENAKVIYTAHYDTCAALPFPNFITPKNISIYILYQIVLLIGFLAVSSAVSFIVGLIFSFFIEDVFWISYITNLAVLMLICYLMIAGPANRHTANDNTSGVVTVLKTMMKTPINERESVAFILFDLEEAGLIGSSSYAKQHKDIRNNKLIVNFDCVSDGKNFLFGLKKNSAKYKDKIEEAFSTEKFNLIVLEKGYIYPSDQASFKTSVGVASLNKSKKSGILYMNRIHTKKDVIFEDENIEFLSDGAIKLLSLI